MGEAASGADATAPGDDGNSGEESGDGIEDLIARIDTILERMEAPDAPLEQTIRDFENGMALTQRAQALLSAAEQRVEVLLGDGAGDSPGE